MRLLQTIVKSVLVCVVILAVRGATAAAPPSCATVRSLSLNSNASDSHHSGPWGWYMSIGNGSTGTNWQNIPASVPGDNYGALMDAGIINDPFYRYNDVNYRWIASEDWLFQRNFTLPPATSVPGTRASVDVVLEGVQVVSDVIINGYLAGHTNDQFQEYRFSLGAHLLNWGPGSVNTIIVYIMSSVRYATAKALTYPLSPYPHAPGYLMGLPHRNFLRGEQSSFGWDWGPAFAPVGIYRPIALRFYQACPLADGAEAPPAHFDYLVPHIFPLPFNRTVPLPLKDGDNHFLVDTYGYVTVPLGLPAARDGDHTYRFEARVTALNNDSDILAHNATVVSAADAQNGTATLRLALTVNNVKLWWPNGYGNRTFYRLKAQLVLISSKSHAIAAVLAVVEKRIAFRSVELITWGDPLDYRPPSGQSSVDEDDSALPRPVMFYRINGYPIFAKGANIVPFDAFQSRVTDDYMNSVLSSAVTAHMTMVRVWGGGIFPQQSFYDMCDEKGLMVWQEMIFACAQYPINDEFLSDVRAEIRHQLRRLGFHPSIMVWSGNNENGIYDKGPGSPYEILDYNNVMATIIREDTSRPVWPSSPSRGFHSGMTASGLPAGTMSHPAPFVAGGNSGDTHFYDYFTCPNVTVYPRSNFGSEFGFQSLPWLANFAEVSKPEDWSLFSPLMNHRQHHPDGNAQIASLLHQNFRVPDLNSTAEEVFRRVIYLSQLQQTLCIADEASFYRRGRDQSYRTMGSLYWQLNQNWQAPSWTSIEYGGEWKILHYAMREVYAPIHISAFINTTTWGVTVHAASDHTVDTLSATVTIELIPFNDTAPEGDSRFVVDVVTNVTLKALQGTVLFTADYVTLLQQHRTRCPTAGDCFLYASLRDGNGLLAASEPLWLAAVKHMNLQPHLTVDIQPVTASAADGFVVNVSTNATAPYLFLHPQSGQNAEFNRRGAFDRNGFLLIAGRPQVLKWRCILVDRPDLCETAPAMLNTFVKGLSFEALNQMW